MYWKKDYYRIKYYRIRIVYYLFESFRDDRYYEIKILYL